MSTRPRLKWFEGVNKLPVHPGKAEAYPFGFRKNVIQFILQNLIDYRAWLVILSLGLVELLVNLAKYYLGRQGMAEVQKRFPKVEPDQWNRLKKWVEQGGGPVLLLMAVPVLSSLLAVTAGVYGLRAISFVWWAYLAVISRNWLLYLLIVAGYYQWR